MAARRQAQEDGCDDALLVTSSGTVLEGPTWSVMWAEGSTIYTPSLALGILDSITRRTLMGLSEVAEAEAPLHRVLEADEVFVVSTSREDLGVSCLDGRTWEAPGPMTREVGSKFRAHVRSVSMASPVGPL
jgi:branched-subunit amino acid aminotransferase/4-amino-4-deoxychorismate lyase